VRLPILFATVVAAVATAASVPGCSGEDTIRCSLSTDCLQGSIPGTCEPSPTSAEHWCAFPDLSCDGSRERWGVKSGDGLAGQCVAAADGTDAGPADASAPLCAANSTRCDANRLIRCDATGHERPAETCAFACVPGLAAAASHCASIRPTYAPEACDGQAAEPTRVLTDSATFDTGGADCTGGVLMQPPNHVEVCVVRYGTFSIVHGATLKVVGVRALAIVADGDLDLAGNIDLSASGRGDGPGGGRVSSGVTAMGSGLDSMGSGGAGFTQAGGSGGGGSHPAGGAATSPQLQGFLEGGPRGGGAFPAYGGGGGGALALVSCHGTVRVSGTIGAGGGGGSGGAPAGQFQAWGGGGGGAGGMVVIQGTAVEVQGNLYANGGAGGGGSGGPGFGGLGADGPLSSTMVATGGIGLATGGMGGAGGARDTPPGAGNTGNTSGGGGGSAGFVAIFVPQGVSPDLTGATTSPAITLGTALGTH
jgi:hypothetical protein